MRHRITRLTVVVAALAVVLFAVPLAAVAFAYLVGDERAELDRAADVAAITAAAQLGAGRPVTTLAGAGRDPSARLGLYDGAGRLVLGDGPALADAVVGTAGSGVTGPGDTGDPVDGDAGDDLVVAVAVAGSDAAGGAPMVVRAATSRWEVYRHLAVVGLGMLLLGVLAPVTAWVLSRRLAGRLTRPLEELSRAARRLGDGDFTARGPVSGIPEIDAVTRSLADTADRIDAALARERAFSADASHQLRTPLAGLRLGLEAALETPDADARPAMRAAIAAADRLHATVEDLLDLARDTHGGEPLDLEQLLEETADAWRGPTAAAGRRLAVRCDDDAPATAASAGAVRQVLTVLLDNALTHGGGEITLVARDAAGALALDVTDEGAGVPDEASLFIRRASASAGRGIGLALARNLAEAEGGRLLLSCTAPPTFTLLLPPRSDEPRAPTANGRLTITAVS